MAKTMAVMLATLLVVSAFVSSSAKELGYGVLDHDVIPGSPPKGPAPNRYKRGCEASEQCRGDGGGNRKLLADSNVQNALHEAQEGAEDLKQKIMSYFH
ncbi:hypothetical protein C2S52_013696 [Perilla frutescens var. hirtella]|nr:hypothetical protein C2S52_013696 [Perilla frutescens var. hirtella]